METCTPVVSCVCPPSTAGVRMHCAGMLGADKPYHHVPLLLRVTECGVVGYQLTQLFM